MRLVEPMPKVKNTYPFKRFERVSGNWLVTKEQRDEALIADIADRPGGKGDTGGFVG